MSWNMIARAALALAAVGLLAAKAPPRLERDAVNGATFSPKTGKWPDPALLKAQILLDRARFSPGAIDARPGENVSNAIAAFEAANGLKADGKLDPETWDKLAATSADPVLVEYAVTAEDVKGPFLEKVPEKMEEMKGLKQLGYGSPLELLAERFHATEDLLKALNPDAAFDKAGQTLIVPAVERPRAPGKAQRVEVDKSERALKALAKDGKVLAVYPASIGSAEKPAPSGSHTVRAVADNPTYTYNPEFRFKGVKAEEKFAIAAGPNNPVGAVWIDLSLETYGIHGTPEPRKVGKSFSHGCVRLTNWDVKDLAALVEKGTEVAFVE